MSEALPWIQVATALPLSDEADALEEITGVERAWTHLVELWCWVGMTRPDGDLAGLSAKRIAKRASWPGDAGAFVEALKELGWLVDEEDGLKFRGWDKRYKATLEKRVKDRQRKARRRRGDGAATSDGSRGDVSEESTGKRRGEERREEDRREDPPSGGAGGAPPAAPPPAAPEPPPAAVAKKTKSKRATASHRTLEQLLNDRPEGEHLGQQRDGTASYVEIWRANFTFVEHFYDEIRAAWDHKARKKRTDMVLYMVRWLRTENERAQERWQRRPENRQSFNERPGADRSRDTRNGGLAPLADYGRAPGDLNVEGRSGGVRATDAIVEGIRAARPTTPEDDEAAAAALAAMKGARS